MSWDLVASFMLQLCVTRTHWQTTLGKYFKRVHALPLGKAAQPKIYHPSRGPLLYSCCMLNFSLLAHFELAIESLHILVGNQIKWCYVCFDVVPNNKGGLSFEHKMEISRALLTSTVQRIVPADDVITFKACLPICPGTLSDSPHGHSTSELSESKWEN